MADEQKSRLYKLKPLTDRLPAVKRPDGHVHFRTKILWVVLMLVFYFVMTNVFLYGLDQDEHHRYLRPLPGHPGRCPGLPDASRA